MNKIEISGNLTKDVELKYTSTNKAKAMINIYEEEEKTFLDITLWEDLAEQVKFYKKDDQISILGVVRKRSYEDKNGKKIYFIEILGREILSTNENKPQEDNQVSPCDFEEKKNDNDPFAEFGDSISIDDSFLD